MRNVKPVKIRIISATIDVDACPKYDQWDCKSRTIDLPLTQNSFGYPPCDQDEPDDECPNPDGHKHARSEHEPFGDEVALGCDDD